MTDYKRLLDEAREARKYSYSPFSHFSVGAALLAEDGKIFRGCNLESAVFSPSLCAERVALAKALSEGVTGFTAIAIVGAENGEEPTNPCFPCGVCRQVLSEHVNLSGFEVVVEKDGRPEIHLLSELLPSAFVFEK
ncbi:MAG: cytidine deaminase [Clostridiales bacterium]|nr:cytidine deaminase [Clostridiales bacterium]